MFDHTDVNRGDGYNTETGIFTAPIDGVYSFTLDLVSVPGALASACIVHNTELVHTVWANGQLTGDLGVASGTIIRSLDTGDEVYVVLFRHLGHAYVDNTLTRFSGHMI